MSKEQMLSNNPMEATRDTRRGLFGEGLAMSRASRAASLVTFDIGEGDNNGHT